MTNDIDINLSLNMEDKTKNLSSWSSEELDAGIVQKRAEVFQLEGQLKTVTDKISKTLDTKKQQLQKEIIKREQELTAETENNEDIAQARKTAEIAEKKYNEAVAKIWKPTEALRAKRAITPIKQRGEIDKEIAELEKKAGVTLDEVQKLQENKKSSQSDYEQKRAAAKKALETADKKLADLRTQLNKTKEKENAAIRQTEEYKRYDAAIREKEALEKEVEKRIAAAQQKLDRATAKQQEAEASRQKPQRVSPPPSVTRPDKLRGRPWTPQEIAAKLKVGESAHAPMILRTRDKKGEPIHDYEYTGISEEELIKYYHMSPAEAKKLAPQYTPEMYNKLLPSLKGMATISTLAGITEGKGGPYRGPEDAGLKGTASHMSTEMALSGWSLDDILKEYSKHKTKGKSRLSQEQFLDLSGLDIISEKYGGDWKKVKSYLQSVLDTSKIGIEDDKNLIMEKSFGVITNMGDQGGLVPWGGTLDILSLLGILRDIKTNQRMSNKMGTQVNMIARAIGIARESGYDIPEPNELSIAHSPSPVSEGHFPTPQLYSIRKMSAEEDDRMIQDALLQYREKGALPNPHYSAKPFEWIGKLYSPLVLPPSSNTKERLPLEIVREEGKRSQYLVGGHNILGMTPQQIADLRGVLTPEDYQRLVNIAFSTKQYTAKMQDGKKVLDQNGQPITEVSEGDKFYHKGVRWNTLRKYLTSPYANAKDRAQNHGLLEGIDMQTFQDEEGIEGRTLGGLTAAGMSKLYRVTKATQGEQAEKLSQQFIDLYVRSINAALKSVNPLDVKDAQSFVYTLMSLGERDEVHEPFVKVMEQALLDSTGPARDVVSNLSEYDLHFSELNKEELEMREKGSEQQKLANAPKATAEIRKRLQAITTGMLDAVFQDASQNGLDTTSPAFQSFLTEVSSIKSEIGDEITPSLSSGGLMQSLKAGFITQDEYEQELDNFQKKIDESEDFTYMYDEWREGVRRQIEASTLSDKDKKTFLSRFALASNLDDSGGTPVQMGYKLARLVVAQQAYDKMLEPIYRGMSLRGSTASKEEIAEMALTETQLREYRDSVALQKRMSEAPDKGYESKEELVKYLLMGLAEDEGVGSREGNAIRRGGRALAGNEEAFGQFVNAFALRMGLGEGGMPPALNTLLSGFVDEGPFAGASRQELMQIGFGVGVTHPSADALEVRDDEIRAREDYLRSLQESAEQEKVTAENSILNIEHLKERLAAVTQELKQLQAEIEKNNGVSEEQFLQKSKLEREQGSLRGMILRATDTELPRQLELYKRKLEKIEPGLPDALLYLLSEPNNTELKDSIISTFDTAGLKAGERKAAFKWAKAQVEWDSQQSVREEQRENQEKAKNAALMQELLAQPQFAEAAQRMLKGLEPTPLPEFLTPGWKAYGDWEVHNDNPQKTTNVISNGVNPSDVIIPDNANLVDAFARLAGQDSESVIPAIDGTVVEQQEATPALEQRAQVEQEATKVDQQSTQALQDESEALKNKAEIARELISALEDKNKTEKEAIATDEKSTKSTRKRVAASETLKQRLANQKVREQIAESKAKEAAALSKAGRGSGAKKQSAGEKEDYSKYAKNLKEITKAMSEREKIEKELNTTPSMLAKGRESREKLLIEYEGIIGKLTAQNQLMIEQGRLSKEQVAQIEAEAQAQRRLNSLKIQGQKYGANSIFDVLKSGVKNTMARMFDYTGVYRVINKMAASLRNVVQLSKELDTAMFNLRVVSGDSREEAKGLISDYNDLAKQLGATTVEIANAANEWMRQGYEAEQATKLITASTYLSKLGMIEASQATEYLTSMIKGFKLEVSDAITVVDKLTKLDMVSATSSGGLAEAMRNVASSAQLANVSLDKTLAYAATIIETTQRDESSVGMSLRTILARYGNVKAGAFSNLNLAATGDADLENINDIEKVLKKIGISIRSSATEFRSFETVLDEVADKWERLDSVSKNAVATAFAGQRQRESFLVLMENMDRVDELTEISAESAGTATEKYQAYYESIESATKRLQTAWENLAHSFEVNGFVKGMTTFLTFVVENLPKIIKMVTVLVAQTNAWKVPTLLRAGLNATGLGALKGALKNNSQEKLGLMDRFKARAIARQNKQKDWKKTTLEKSDGLDLFGLKGKMSEVASNMDKLVLALDANTKAQTQQTQVETQQIRSGTQANILSRVPNASEGYSIDEFEKTQKVPEFKLKNLRSDKDTKSKIKDLYPNVPEFKLKNLQADGTDLPPMQNTRRTGLMGAAGAGIAAGVIGGITQEGSTEAKIASGATQGAFAALGGIASIWLGPLGTMLGSVLGDVLGPIVADAVDKEADDRKKLVEVGQKQLDMLSSLDSSFDTLDSSSRVELLSADDISSIRDIVSSIEETIQAEDSNLGKHLKKAFEEIGASKFYDNWDSKLVLGNQEERRAITRALQLAKSEAESEAYENSMAEKKYAALTTAEAKTYYKKVDEANFERAYIKSGVSEYSQYELTKKGIDGVINEVAKQLEGVDLKGTRLRDSFGELTEEAEAYIRTLMKTDDQMQNLLAGQTLTLNEALQEDNTELLEQFATALGVSVDRLQGFADTVGALTLGDLLAGMGETREKITSYTGLLSDFFTTGTVSPENLEDIIANYPDLINKVSNPKELLAGVQEKISQLGTQYVSAGISSWFSSEAVFDQFRKNFADNDGFKEIFSNKELLGDVKSLDEAKGIILKMQQEGSKYSEQAKELYDYIIEAGDAAQVELEYIRKQLEYTAEIEATMDTVDKNYEKQINALEEQKSALEDINSQREYENKLIEAKIKLENAQNEKKKVWREGVGWVYETDTTAIADAQQELDDLANQKTVDELQAQIDELQAQREYVAGIPDRLELEQANENFKTWTDKLGLVNDNQLSVIDKIQEVWTELKTRSDEIEGRSETKSQFEQASQQKTAAEISLVGSGGSASAPASGSAQANLQKAYEAVKKFDQSDNSQEAQTARTKFADALKNYKEVYGKYVGAGGTVSKEQELLNALQADSDDLRFAPKWEGVRFPGLSNKGKTFTYYASFEDVTDFPDSGWRQGKMRDVVLLGGINQRADEYGVKNFDELRNMNGQLFMNTEGVDQVFWAYGGHVYKASRHQEDWKATQNVKDDAPYYNSGKKSKGSGLTTADNNKFYYAEGTLSAPGGASMVNDDPQYGLEGIITPQGTLTALPSKSGVVPADMTRNVWQLGEVAPNLIKQLVDINGKFNSPLGFGTDESFNVDHLDVHMVAQPGFDMDDFVRQLRAARDLSKHS